MAYDVRWTASARRDVKTIIHHIAVILNSPQAATEHLDAFINAANILSETPTIRALGTHLALYRRNLRPFFVKRYVMLYAYENECVTVYRVFHMYQDYTRFINE